MAGSTSPSRPEERCLRSRCLKKRGDECHGQHASLDSGKRRHKAKVGNRPILRVMARDPTAYGTPPQSATNASFSACQPEGCWLGTPKPWRRRVRVQPEEPAP